MEMKDEKAEVLEVEQIRGRFRIQLDNGDRYWLSKTIYQERPIRVGEEVEAKTFAQWVMQHQYRPALERAVSMLAGRACSRGEISRKLQTSGYSRDTIEMVLYKLEKNNLLDDRAFGTQWAHYRNGQKYGPRRIETELRQKGLSPEEAEEAVSGLDEKTQTEQALQLAWKGLSRRKPGEDFRKTKQRTLAGIVRRGYDWETAKEACNRAAEEMDEDPDDD